LLNDTSISLVIISNNSEKTIARTLQSVDSIVDEIIFIDTGITDSTLEIARSFNAKVFPYKWENNFSQAKNFGIGKASGKWILSLDSDEYLAEHDLALIKEAVKDSNSGAFITTQRSRQEDGSTLDISCIRLFRNIPVLRYKFAVHEMLATEGLKEKTLELKKPGIIIEHSGYQSKELFRLKEKRNLNIIKTQLFKEKLTDAEYFHYGVYFLRSNLNSRPTSQEKNIGEKLIEIKNKYFNESSFNLNQDFFLFYSVIADFLYKYEKPEQINNLFAEASEIYKYSPYIFFKFAELYYKMADYHKSIQLLEKCLSFNDNEYNPEQLIDPAILNTLSRKALEKCYERTSSFSQ
jgi:glycosyltransferase involved in cell wall biosynthesis